MRELHRNAYGTDEGLDPAALLRDVERAQQVSPRSCTFGLLEDGTPAALVYLKTWYDEEPDVGLLGGFCISGEYRGCGLSAQILGQAISVYRSLGKTWLCAHVAEKNLARAGLLSQIRLRAARRASRCERPALPHVQAPDGGIIRLDKAASPLYTLSE